MTRNQIEFWSLQETKRANRAKEVETNRSNVTNERETFRHNTTVEGETSRSNLAKELQAKNDLLETVRHNKSVESETNRHNVAQEDFNNRSLNETTRHNKANESIGYANVQLGYANVGLGYSTLAETARHNSAVEEETKRNNVTTSNINTSRNYINSLQLEETVRHNKQVESANQQKVDYETSNLSRLTEMTQAGGSFARGLGGLIRRTR